MNKAVTIIVIIIVVLLVGFLISALLGPQGFKMERSLEINAPRALVYKNISDYRNWLKWSPWAEIDTNCVYDYYGSQGQVGAGYKWKGNNKVGEGDMHTTDMTDGSSLTSQLTFIKPFASSAVATFKLEDGANGTTKVTWGFSQNYSFSQRPMMLFINMEKMLGGDYEKGLAKLKAASEKEAAAAGPQANLQIKEVTWTGRTYLANRSEVLMKDIGTYFQHKMPETYNNLQSAKLTMDGAPSGLYFTWDTANSKTDMAVAIPVKDASKVAAPYQVISVPTSKAVMADYYGSYANMKEAHDAILQYINDKGYKVKHPVIEEYVTDPATEKDPNKILTKVYYLIEG